MRVSRRRHIPGIYIILISATIQKYRDIYIN